VSCTHKKKLQLKNRKRCVELPPDNPDLLEMLATLLGARGFITFVARNGLEALELLENSEPPSVILLDLNMPVMDGRKFLAHKAENPEIASIPVIITTGNVEQAPTNLPVLRKPFELQDLLHAVSPYCDTP
jgi:CheY-like chemotaxis protein